MKGYKDALLDWWRVAWAKLLDYQRRFVENGHSDDGSWAGEIGTALLQNYEWRIVRANVYESKLLKSRLLDGLRTAFGGSSGDSADEVGRAFTNYAYERIKSGRLLTGTADDAFQEFFPKVEAFIIADKLPFIALAVVHNLRIGQPLQLSDTVTIRPLTSEERGNIIWRDNTWDDRWELPAAIEIRFDLPILVDDQTGDIGAIQQKLRDAAEDALMAIAVATPLHGTLGMMLIGPRGWMPSPSLMLNQFDYLRGSVKTHIQPVHDELIRCAWDAIHVHPDSKVRLGAERLWNARRHENVGNALLEAVVALEAAIGEDADKELSRRISLLTARLVAEDLKLTQRQVYDDLISAFEFRTRILRGKVVDNDEMRERALLNSTENAVRRLLQMRVLKDPRLSSDSLELILRNPT